LNANIPDNKLVNGRKNTAGNNLKVTPSDPQAEPKNIIKLQQEISSQWSSILRTTQKFKTAYNGWYLPIKYKAINANIIQSV
jgi:hypothetical protein